MFEEYMLTEEKNLYNLWEGSTDNEILTGKAVKKE